MPRLQIRRYAPDMADKTDEEIRFIAQSLDDTAKHLRRLRDSKVNGSKLDTGLNEGGGGSEGTHVRVLHLC